MKFNQTMDLPLPGERPHKRRRGVLVVALAVILAAFVGGAWWFGVGLPARQAAEASAAEQAKTQAAAKKKADDSAAFWAKIEKDNKARAEKAAADAAAFNASQDRAAEQADSIKNQMEAQGWKQFSGDFYYQVADKSEYSCGYSQCLVYHVTTMAPAGCSGGLYVEATVDAGGASVGRANSITASLPQGKDAIVKLTDTSGVGESMGLTDLHCLGG